MTEEQSQVLRDRRGKLDELLRRGIRPFEYSFDRSHTSAAGIAAFASAEAGESLDADGNGPRASVGGRIVAWRGHGKSAFAHLEDGAGRIQLYFRRQKRAEIAFGDADHHRELVAQHLGI